MYQFEENIDHGSLFIFDKRWIDNMNWAAIPKASKAILPVLLSHTNKKGVAFPSERRIAILTGRNDKTVREGIRGLEGFPGFSMGNRITSGGKRGKVFHLPIMKIETGTTFPFYRCVFYSGSWCQLIPTAQSLYPVMRHYGQFDFDDYLEETDTEAEVHEFEEVYKSRQFDFCDADLNVLADHAGIIRKSIRPALNNLEEAMLIKTISRSRWRVHLRPDGRYKRSFLNKQVMGRYKHEKPDG